MTKRHNLDFTQGDIKKHLFHFSWPIFMTNLLQSSYQIIDSLWVGNLIGDDALGAVSLSSAVIFTVLSFIIGINGATLTVLSQKRGANDEEGLKQALNAFVVIQGSLALFLSFLGFVFSGTILNGLGTPASLFPLAQSYLQVNFLGIIFLFGYNFIGTVLRAMGNSSAPLRFVTIAVILNTFLSPLFIAGFKLGISGAALSTVLAQGVSFVYGLYYSIRKAGVPYSVPCLPSKELVKVIAKLGIPGGLQMVAISGGSLAIMSVVASFGGAVVAGFGAAQRIEQLIMLPSVTLGSAVQSMAGQNIGANKWERVSAIAYQGCMAIVLVSLLIGAAVFIGSSWLIQLFISEADSIQFGKTYLKIIAFFFPFLGLNFVLNGIVRSAGAMFQVLVLNIISFWVLRFPLSYLFSAWRGEEGIALGIGCSFVISSMIAVLYYRFGNWKNLKLFKPTKPAQSN